MEINSSEPTGPLEFFQTVKYTKSKKLGHRRLFQNTVNYINSPKMLQHKGYCKFTINIQGGFTIF